MNICVRNEMSEDLNKIKLKVTCANVTNVTPYKPPLLKLIKPSFNYLVLFSLWLILNK